MKKIFFFMLAVIISLTAGMMVSCGSNDNDDNNEGTVGELPYVAQAAKYNISSSSSEWKSIELTEGGRFIAIKKGYTSGAKAATRANDSDNGIVFGRFTFDGTTYTLNGFGTMRVTAGANGSFQLSLTINGTSQTVNATKEETIPSSSLTDFICRTWTITQFRLIYKQNGETVFDGSASSGQGIVDQFYKKLGRDWEFVGDWDPIEDLCYEQPRFITFSHSGSYLVTYSNGETWANSWRWLDESKGTAQYDDSGDGDYEGTSIVFVRDNNHLLLTDSYNSGGEEVSIIYTLAAAK